MGNKNYDVIEARYQALKESLLPGAICRKEDNPNVVTVYIDPKKIFTRKERKNIEFAIKIVSEGRIHAF